MKELKEIVKEFSPDDIINKYYLTQTEIDNFNSEEDFLYDTFEKDNTLEWLNVWDDLTTNSNNLIPTPEEYLDACWSIIERSFRRSGNRGGFYPKVVANQNFVHKIANYRCGRTWVSHIYEEIIKFIYIKLGYKVYSNKLLDHVMGVDLAVVQGLKVYYIHITTAGTGIDFKEKRTRHFIDNDWRDVPRNFKNDITITYHRGNNPNGLKGWDIYPDKKMYGNLIRNAKGEKLTDLNDDCKLKQLYLTMLGSKEFEDDLREISKPLHTKYDRDLKKHEDALAETTDDGGDLPYKVLSGKDLPY